MNRQIEYAGQILTDTELLTIQRHGMAGLGWLAQAVLGTATAATGLACTPTSPAGMTVNVGTGAIFSLKNLDDTSYGSLAADTTAAHQIIKEGLNTSVQNYACPAPTTAGQSVVYLIQAQYQDIDTNAAVLQYFDSANPSVAYTGPGNSGASQNTTRQSTCVLQLKTGTAATTGSQTAPTADSGWSPLYTVTVAYGATTITSGNIAFATGNPFIPYTLPQLGSGFASPAPGTATGKVVQTTSNTAISVVASSFVMTNGTASLSAAISASINTGSTGLGGMDTGSVPVSSWLYVWGVSNGTSTGAILSASNTSPVLPSGYTFAALMSEVRTDASGYLLRTLTRGKKTQYVTTASTNTASYPLIQSIVTGGAGSASLTAFVPPTAAVINFSLYANPTTTSTGSVALAPNNAITSTGTNLQGCPVFFSSQEPGASLSYQGSFLIETMNIYYYLTSGGSGSLTCNGWESA